MPALTPREQAFVARFVAYPHSVDQNDAAIAEKLAREVGLEGPNPLLNPTIAKAIKAEVTQ